MFGVHAVSAWHMAHFSQAADDLNEIRHLDVAPRG
jgi:hypothetical protein